MKKLKRNQKVYIFKGVNFNSFKKALKAFIKNNNIAEPIQLAIFEKWTEGELDIILPIFPISFLKK